MSKTRLRQIPIQIRGLIRETVRFVFSRRVQASFDFFLKLMGVVSAILIFDYFQSESRVTVRTEAPIAIIDIGKFLSEPVIGPEIESCIAPSIEESTPIAKAENKIFAAHYLAGQGPKIPKAPRRWFWQRKNTRPFHDVDANPFSEETMLKHSIEQAGYAPVNFPDSMDRAKDWALFNPRYFIELLKQRYGIEMVPDLQPGMRYHTFPGDPFEPCVNRLAPSHLKRGGYYKLADSRVIWTPIVIENDSNRPVTDVTLYIDRPWKGRTELPEQMVLAEGGTVVHKSTFYYVLKYPVIMGGAPKLLALKTWGRSLDSRHLRIEYSPYRAPSFKIFLGGLIVALLASILFYRCDEEKKSD